MNYCIEVKVDTNDADYVTEVSVIDEETLNRLKPLFEAIKNCDQHNNYPTSDHLQDESPHDLYPQFNVPLDPRFKDWDERCTAIELFEETCEPHPEGGYHSIVSIYVYPEVEKERLV